MTRTDIINYLIEKYGYKNYLEIGVQKGVNFRAVKAKYKIGVDPDPASAATHKITSDEFFKQEQSARFDIVFIDGLHHSEQTFIDIINSLNRLKENGAIVMHDCLPTDEKMQQVPRLVKKWTGDVWKAFVRFRTINPSFARTINTDYGCGLILPFLQEQRLQAREQLTWQNLEINRKKWMNIISPKEFKEIASTYSGKFGNK